MHAPSVNMGRTALGSSGTRSYRSEVAPNCLFWRRDRLRGDCAHLLRVRANPRSDFAGAQNIVVNLCNSRDYSRAVAASQVRLFGLGTRQWDRRSASWRLLPKNTENEPARGLAET